MKKQEFEVETGLSIITCTCGIIFAVPTDLKTRWLKSHELFYCPVGHHLRYEGESETEALERRLSYTRSLKDSYRSEARTNDYRARYYKGQLAKLKKGQNEPPL